MFKKSLKFVYNKSLSLGWVVSFFYRFCLTTETLLLQTVVCVPIYVVKNVWAHLASSDLILLPVEEVFIEDGIIVGERLRQPRQPSGGDLLQRGLRKMWIIMSHSLHLAIFKNYMDLLCTYFCGFDFTFKFNRIQNLTQMCQRNKKCILISKNENICFSQFTSTQFCSVCVDMLYVRKYSNVALTLLW